jgi:protein SCO1/2/putative membrane protein
LERQLIFVESTTKNPLQKWGQAPRNSEPVPIFALCALVLLTAGCETRSRSGAASDDLYPLGDFSLTERSGQTVRQADLLGKVWVAAFVFTRCAGPCAQVSGTMARLQHELADEKDVRLVSITVDPEYDKPDVLARYAARYGADPGRWLFLTGEPASVYRLIRDGFHLTAEQNEGAERTRGNEVMHDTRLAVVDREGHVRGYFQATQPESIALLEEKVRSLAGGDSRLRSLLPACNALLNATCALLLAVGFVAIRLRRVALHKACMLSALGVSAIFLASYLTYHYLFGEQTSKFPRGTWVWGFYIVILVSHSVLAAVVAPLALFTAYQGLRSRLDRHVRVARWTLPIWLYVSITGVLVYWMLYYLSPSLKTG